MIDIDIQQQHLIMYMSIKYVWITFKIISTHNANTYIYPMSRSLTEMCS